MTKRNRLRRAWQRNWEFWTAKGIYFCMCNPVKDWMTPKQVTKYLKKHNPRRNRFDIWKYRKQTIRLK